MNGLVEPEQHSLDLSHHMVRHIRELGWSPMKVIGKLNPADFGAIALSGGVLKFTGLRALTLGLPHRMQQHMSARTQN